LEWYCIAIPKPRRKQYPIWGFLQTPWAPGRVLHYPNKTKKECTFMKIICKYYGLNYFGPIYWRDIAYAQNYTMHVQYLS